MPTDDKHRATLALRRDKIASAGGAAKIAERHDK